MQKESEEKHGKSFLDETAEIAYNRKWTEFPRPQKGEAANYPYKEGKHMSYSKVSDGKKLLYTQLSEQIYQYIKAENLRIGDKLPGERKLAALWKVSRPTLREAIRELENQGVVKAEVGKGTFVADSADSQQFQVKLASRNFLELFEIKTVLERYTLEKLVHTVNEEQLAELERMAVQMNAIAATGIMPEEMDEKFHQYLMECYENQELAHMVVNMIFMYRDFVYQMQRYMDKKEVDYNSDLIETIPYHLEMVRKMKQRDVQGALENYDQIVKLDLKIYKEIV